MKKYDKGYIFYHLIVDFIVILLFAFFMLTNILTEGEEPFPQEQIPYLLLYFAIIFIAVYIVKTVYSIFYYKTSGYELKDGEIVCKRGVLFRKKSILEYKKINAVNKKQNIIHKLFKIAVLTLDSGSANTAYSAEILIIEKDSVIDSLLNEIKLRQNNEPTTVYTKDTVEEKENLYSFTAGKRVMYSVLNLISTLVIITVICAFTLALYSSVLPFIENLAKGEGVSFLIALLCFSILAYIIASAIVLVVSIIYSIFGYFKFRVYKNDNDIEISYGLLVKNVNTFKLNRIKGVVITQGLIQRLFKFVTVKLEVIGYNSVSGSANGNENVDIGVLFPLCKESELEENIKKVLPSYVPVKKEHKTKKYFPFISWTLCIMGIVMALILGIAIMNLVFFKVNSQIILAVIIGVIALYLLISLIIMANALFEYKNNGINISDDKLTIVTGGFIKKTTVIFAKNIVAVEDITTPLRKKCGIYSYDIHFRSNAQTNVIHLKNVDKSLIETLRGIVRY